jgi:hypothetical protein
MDIVTAKKELHIGFSEQLLDKEVGDFATISVCTGWKPIREDIGSHKFEGEVILYSHAGIGDIWDTEWMYSLVDFNRPSRIFVQEILTSSIEKLRIFIENQANLDLIIYWRLQFNTR